MAASKSDVIDLHYNDQPAELQTKIDAFLDAGHDLQDALFRHYPDDTHECIGVSTMLGEYALFTVDKRYRKAVTEFVDKLAQERHDGEQADRDPAAEAAGAAGAPAGGGPPPAGRGA